MYRPTHVAAIKGNSKVLKNWLNPESKLILKADAYGKSPIFYSILKREQEYTETIIEYFISLKSQNEQLEGGLHSLRNDFQLIIKNSSRLLYDFISKILLQTECVQVPESLTFPHVKLVNAFAPNLGIFGLPKEVKSMPGVIKYTAFSIDAVEYSKENIAMLDSIKDCKNNRIFECLLIKNIIDCNWDKVSGWVIAFSSIQILSIFAYIVVLVESSWFLYLLFMFIYLMLLIWKILQIFTEENKVNIYDFWNFVDSVTIMVSIYWLLSNFLGFNSEYESYLIAIMLTIRGLTAFKVATGTRNYLRLIIASINDIKYFLIVFIYSTLLFSVIIAIAQDDIFDFETLWNQSWNLNFGGEINMDKGNQTLIYITVFVARIVNVVLMLNMLVSILGDSFDKFLIERHIIDYKEKLESAIEIQKMMFCRRVRRKKQFLHFIVSPYEDNPEFEEWQGRVLYMEKKQDMKIQVVIDKINGVDKKIDSKISAVENKIVGVENKINGVENKMTAMDIKISKLDADIQKIIGLFSSK